MTEYLTNLFSALTPLWEMSLTAAFAAAVVLVLRLILKRRAPRQVVCLLWLIVFARLLLPFSLESPVSLVPQALTEQPAPAVSQPADTPAQDQVPTPAVPTASAGASVPAVSAPPSASAPISSAEPVEHVDVQAPPVTVSAVPYGAVLAGVWLVGAAAMLLYGILSYVRLRRRVFDAVRAEDGAWEHPAVRSPFILGLFRPKIYLPAGLSGPARQFILCHERAHLKRLDHIVKPVCWLALALHWFNPMAWAAFLLMSRDIEVACDQAVLRQLGEGVKADYSATLLSLATGGKFPAPCPLAFGEGDAKSRIKSVLSYKKPTLWIIVAAVAVAVIAAVCLLTDPKAPAAEDPEPSASPSAQPEPTPSAQPGEGPAAQPDHSPLILRHLAGEELELDLDGDGVAERLSVVCLEVGGGNFYDVLTVRGADGETVATLDTYMGIDGSTPVYPDLGTPVLAPDPASGTVLVEYAGLSVQVPVEEDFFTASGQPVLAFTPSSDHSLIWNDGVLYLRSTGHIALSDAEAYPATGQRQFTPVECLYRLDYEPSSGLFSAVPVSLSPGCDQLSFFPAELVGFSSAPYQESELTLLDMDAASGTRLYADSRGLVSALSSGRMGYVYINGELLNLNAAGQYGAENLYASLLYCGTDPNGYWQVTVELEGDTQLLVTAFLYWYEQEQAWTTNLPGITVTLVTLQEGSTYYYTGFELDTPVGSCSFTGAHVDGQPTLTYCSDLTGDGAGDYIVMLCPGNGTGPVKHDLHIFDGVTLEEYDASGVWRVIPEAVEFTSDESNYYIAAPNFTTAVSKARVQAQVAPLNTMFDTMEFSGEICWLSVEGGKLCISYACIVGDYWTSYGTLRAELAVVNGALAAQRYYYIAPDGTVTDGTHTVEVSLDYSYSGGVLGPVEQLAEPFVLQITVPSQFQPVAGIGELAEVNDAGKIVGTGPAFALVRVSRDYVLDESVGQTQQLITSGGVYSEHVGENAEISRYTTSAGYDAVVYEYHYGDETGLPRSLYAFVRVAPEYVLHVSLGNTETIPTRYEILDSILVGNQPGKLVTMDTLPTDPEEYYLVAQLPEENIWLYSRNYGQETLLVRNGAQQSYDYTAHIHYMNLPRMVMLDTNCVGVISQVGAGTGTNEEELVVYDLRDPSDWRDYRYDGSSVAEAFNRNNTLVYDADTNSLAMTYGGVTYHTGTLAEELARSLGLEAGFTGAACADRSIVLYQFNGDDTVQVTMDTCIAGYPVSIGVTGFELTWAVRFTGNGFETVPGSFEII